jgi:hypothetical protein
MVGMGFQNGEHCGGTMIDEILAIMGGVVKAPLQECEQRDHDREYAQNQFLFRLAQGHNFSAKITRSLYFALPSTCIRTL